MKQQSCRRFFLSLIVIWGVTGFPAAPARADLSGDIKAVLADKLLNKGEIGIELIQLGKAPADARSVYEFKATTPRIPASNLKLATTSAAMDKLGAEFEFKTVLAMRGSDLALIGDGDPTFGDAEMLRKLGWGVDTVFKAWADMLRKRGVTSVRDVYVDDSVFDTEMVHPNWPTDQLHKRYVAQVAGLNLNANCLDFYLTAGSSGQTVEYRIDPATAFASIANTCVTGSKNAIWLSRQLGTNDIILRGETNASDTEPVSVTIDDPPMFAGTVLKETLMRNGIKVTGQVKRDRTIRGSNAESGKPDTAWDTLAVHTTPLSSVLNRANKDSMNLYAESLCKRLGFAVSGESGSWNNGTKAVAAFLGSVGVGKDEYFLDDGCGLSKKNGISPHAIGQVLVHQFHAPGHEVFMSSLAVAGTDGTFESRFRDSDLRGRVFGKSGYVVGVSSLSGYLHAKDGQWYAFSIIMNALPDGTNATAKLLQEKIVKALDSASLGSVAAGR